MRVILLLLLSLNIFGAEFPNKDDSGKVITYQSGLPRDDKIRVRFIGTHNFTIAPNATVSSDWTIPQLQYNGQNVDSFFRGMVWEIVGGCNGDKVDFQIVTPDGLTVVEEFGTSYYMFKDSVNSLREHKALLPPTYKIRIKYYSTCLVGAQFIGNLFRYIETP